MYYLFLYYLFDLFCINIDLEKWKSFTESLRHPEKEIKIAVCGKYTDLMDAYKSIDEAFIHSGAENNVKVKVKYLSTEGINKNNVDDILKEYNGVLIPGGFGERGIEGKIEAIRYARENKIPFLGICLGMQCAVIEYARNVMGWENANSLEF